MDWIETARGRLTELRGDAAGWGYRPGTAPYVEPTVLACLGMLATDPDGNGASLKLCRASADWLASIQQPEGCLGLSSKWKEPWWPTSYAVLLWSAVEQKLPENDPARSKYAEACRSATDFLLSYEGVRIPQDAMNSIGHDGMIPGWPWVNNTHSWVEPTAMALLALRRRGLGRAKRAAQGLQLLRNRALPQGGWNYGNTVVLGNTLRPHIAPTGFALLGLAGDDESSTAVKGGADYLEREIPVVRAAASLGAALLALAAWGRSPKPAASWLAEAYPASSECSDAAYQIAFLLLAARAAATLEIVGVASAKKAEEGKR